MKHMTLLWRKLMIMNMGQGGNPMVYWVVKQVMPNGVDHYIAMNKDGPLAMVNRREALHFFQKSSADDFKSWLDEQNDIAVKKGSRAEPFVFEVSSQLLA